MKMNAMQIVGLLLVVGVVYTVWNGGTGLEAGVADRLLMPVYYSVRCDPYSLDPVNYAAGVSFSVPAYADTGQATTAKLTYRNQPACDMFADYWWGAPTKQCLGRIVRVMSKPSGTGEQSWQPLYTSDVAYAEFMSDPSLGPQIPATFELSKDKDYRLEAVCEYATIGTGGLTGKVEYKANNANSYQVQVLSQGKKWNLYPGGAPAPIQSDNGCYLGALKSATGVSNTPIAATGYATIAKFINNAAAKFNMQGLIAVPSGDKGTIDQAGTAGYAQKGDGFHFVGEWKDAPATYNLLDYNGQKVFCSGVVGTPTLFSTEKVATNNGDYYMPTNVLQTVACCNQGNCPVGSQCDSNFKCVAQAECSTDAQCLGKCTEGFKKVATDSYDYTTGEGLCQSSKCVCTTKRVACSTMPDTCGEGWKCDMGVGKCMPQENCPKGSWCVQKPGCRYTTGACDTGLTPCKGTDPCIGACKASCGTEGCASASDCNDGNPKTIDQCIKPFFGSAYCEHKEVPEGCTGDGQCDDNNPKTIDKCANRVCTHEQIAGCTTNADCDDNNAKTTDTCNNRVCSHVAEDERTCAQKFSAVTQPTLYIDCVVQGWAKNIAQAITALVLFIGTAIVTSQVTRNTFTGRNDWKRPIVSVIVGIIVVILYTSI